MIKVHKSIPIKASPADVWTILGDLARAPEYVPGIVSATVEGLQRLCIDSSGNQIRESVMEYSESLRRFTLRHVQVPLPVNNSQTTFSVQANGVASIVELIWELEPLDATAESQMTPMIEGAAQMTLENLRQRVEAQT